MAGAAIHIYGHRFCKIGTGICRLSGLVLVCVMANVLT